ncbi:helix-turn-helix domain-containing protein [Paenibacillus kobensis]|uniref:helix-turn-helix domain-containing protein n=1 Tax=Paenibacillus kobensis TaxID=59841 RepID=UPI000FD923A6|nr:helix-turn-helix transcriptional regulator [Paenibacillus kobensis]
MNFGEYIRETREKRGMTVNQLAIYSGVSSGLISKLENGKRGTPKPDTIEKIAKGLKVDYNDLMRIAGYVPEADNQEMVYPSSDVLPPDQTNFVLRELVKKYDIDLSEPEKAEKLEQIIQLVFQKKNQ